MRQAFLVTYPNFRSFFLFFSVLESGHLLLSVRSRCRVCGKEVVDPRELPDEFLQHGIHIPPEEYTDAVSLLMQDRKFHCHIW